MEKNKKLRVRRTWKQRFLGSTAAAAIAATSVLSPVPFSAGADDIGKDGLPNLKAPYEESIWYRGNPLGVAGDFHIFAFDSFTDTNHVNGNVATPHLIIQPSAKGPSPNQYVGRLVNVVSEQLDVPDGEFNMAKIPDIVLPPDYELYSSTGNKLNYPTSVYSMIAYKGAKDEGADGFSLTLNSSLRQDPLNIQSHFGHYTETFMDFEQIKKDYESRSASLASLSENLKSKTYEPTEYNTTLDIELKDEGENVINLKVSDLYNAHDVIDPATGEITHMGDTTVNIRNINADKVNFKNYNGIDTEGYRYNDDQQYRP